MTNQHLSLTRPARGDRGHCRDSKPRPVFDTLLSVGRFGNCGDELWWELWWELP